MRSWHDLVRREYRLRDVGRSEEAPNYVLLWQREPRPLARDQTDIRIPSQRAGYRPVITERNAVGDVARRPIRAVRNQVQVSQPAGRWLWRHRDRPDRVGDLPELLLGEAVRRQEVGHARRSTQLAARLV